MVINGLFRSWETVYVNRSSSAFFAASSVYEALPLFLITLAFGNVEAIFDNLSHTPCGVDDGMCVDFHDLGIAVFITVDVFDDRRLPSLPHFLHRARMPHPLAGFVVAVSKRIAGPVVGNRPNVAAEFAILIV